MDQAQDIERVIGANGNLDFGNGPAEFDSRGTVKNAIGRAQQERLCGAQPIREQPARSEIEKASRLGSATERDTIFGVRGSEEIRAGGRSGRNRRTGSGHFGCQGVRAEFALSKAADQFIAGEEAGVQRHVAAVASCAAEGCSKGPGVALGKNRVTNHVLASAKPASGSGIRKQNAFIPGVARPTHSEAAARNPGSNIPNCYPCRCGWRGCRILHRGARQRVVDIQRIGVGQSVGPRNVDAFAVRTEKRTLRAPCESRAKNIIEDRECQGRACAEDSFLRQSKHYLQALWPSFNLRRKEFLAIEQVENRVGNAQRAAELTVATDQRGALLTNFFKVNRDVCRVVRIIELDVNVFFVYRLEVARPRQS